MQWAFDKAHLPSYIRIKRSGKVTLGEYTAMWDEILESAFWRPGLPVLFDTREVEPIEDGEELAIGAIEYFEENMGRIGMCCIASISIDRDHYIYARQFQHGIRLFGSDVTMLIFNDEATAVEWMERYSHVIQPAMSMAADHAHK
jgi:hypothetical protein